jgi:ribosome-binding protein aMBF1 (putative translation factor)
MAAHFIHHAGSGNCALCGQQSADLIAVTRDNSIKQVRICSECYTKMTGTPNDNALFTRVMRMLD